MNQWCYRISGIEMNLCNKGICFVKSIIIWNIGLVLPISPFRFIYFAASNLYYV